MTARARWLRIAVACLIIALLVAQVPINEVTALLAGTKPGCVMAAIAAAMAGQLLAGIRFAALLRAAGMPIGSLEAFAVNLSTVFYGLFLPGGNVTGAVLRFASLMRQSGDPQAVVIGIACDRLIATVTLCLSGLLAALFASGGQEPWLTALMLAAFLALAAIQILLFSPMALPSWRSSPRGAESAVDRQPKEGSFKGRARAALRQLAAHAQGLAARARQLPFSVQATGLLLGLASHLIGILAWWFAAQALDLGLGATTLGWVRGAAMTVALLPLSVSGIGLREGTIVVLLGALGTSAPAALAFALLVFVATVLAPGLAGGLVEARRLGAMTGSRP